MIVSSSPSSSFPLLLTGRSKPAGNCPVLQPISLNRWFSSSPNYFIKAPEKIKIRAVRVLVTAGELTAPIISPNDHWGTWAALFTIAAFGIWSEKTKIGSTMSGAVVSILMGLAASNIGIIATQAPAYNVVMGYLLPLAVPLLLLNADLRRVIKSTGTLLLAFLLGSVATTIGTIVAYMLVPMRSLGQDSWKIAAALMSSYIGGAVNYVAVSEALGLSPSVLAAGFAVDNVMCAIYFTLLFALASKVPPEAPTSSVEGTVNTGPKMETKQHVLQSATAIAISFTVCKAAAFITKRFGFQGGTLPCITAVTVVLATMFPSRCGSLAPAGEAIALILMQVFFVVVGANGSISNVINTAPGIFGFAFVQLAVHLAVILGVGRFLRFDLKLLLLASNANIGGPTTACGMATAKGWRSLMVPGILAGIFGISIATFIGIGFGLFILRYM